MELALYRCLDRPERVFVPVRDTNYSARIYHVPPNTQVIEIGVGNMALNEANSFIEAAKSKFMLSIEETHNEAERELRKLGTQISLEIKNENNRSMDF